MELMIEVTTARRHLLFGITQVSDNRTKSYHVRFWITETAFFHELLVSPVGGWVWEEGGGIRKMFGAQNEPVENNV